MSEQKETKVFITNESLHIEALKPVPVTSHEAIEIKGEVKVLPEKYEYIISSNVDGFHKFLAVIPDHWTGTSRVGSITEALNYWFNNGWEIHYQGQITTNNETYIILRKPNRT
jgi:hypothetical protein